MRLRRLLLLRHGETDFNVERRMQGHLDSALTELGVAQSRAVAPLLAQRRPERLLSSELRRAADTAEEVGLACGLPVKLDARLRETNLGEWEGRTTSEIEAAEPGVIARWRSDPTWAPPGGESRLDVVARSMPVITELEAEHADGTHDGTDAAVLLCGHGGVFAGLTAALLDLPHANWPVISGLGNCRWAELTRRDGVRAWRLAGYNLGPRPRPAGGRCCWCWPTRWPSTARNEPNQPTTPGYGRTSRQRRSVVVPNWSRAPAGRPGTRGRH